jgi:acyl-coenzyme A thioesterase PaaI-like protein
MFVNFMKKQLQSLKIQEHSRCFVCGAAHPRGLGMEFQVCDESRVVATFDCGDAFQGYEGILHGGIICSLLDGAMTNCLFAYGTVTVTGELTVQFKQPVAASRPAVVKAWIKRTAIPCMSWKLNLSRMVKPGPERPVSSCAAVRTESDGAARSTVQRAICLTLCPCPPACASPWERRSWRCFPTDSAEDPAFITFSMEFGFFIRQEVHLRSFSSLL